MSAMLDDRNNEIFWPENRFHLLFSEGRNSLVPAIQHWCHAINLYCVL